jgi:CRP-like cAMP-binding protein
MEELQLLKVALKAFSGMDEEAFALSAPYWEKKLYHKGEFFNQYRNVCKHMGFVLNGVFRAYYLNEHTTDEKNVFFFTQHQVIVSYKSFLEQAPCNYHTEALCDSSILYIHINNLNRLYAESRQWEHFGRKVAETAFGMAMTRMEDYLFLSPEERYQYLMNLHPELIKQVPLYHIASYLGIAGPSLSRIRKRMMSEKAF